MSSEKTGLLPSVAPSEHPIHVEQKRPRRTAFILLALISCWCSLNLVRFGVLGIPYLSSPSRHHAKVSHCAQIDPILPQHTTSELQEMDLFFASDSFRNGTITRMTGAVQIPSISYDDFGKIGEDKRWEVFYEFEDFLKATFPRIHSELKKEMVNTHGLLYTWQGSDSSLKPTILMAHQDVVPVPDSTVDAWTHPPFSGYYDGKYIWGRGSSDCKNQLMAIMESTELMLAAGFKPKRTVIISFGIDEEASGTQGAGTLGPFILDRYGKDSIAAIVDEGTGLEKQWGSIFAVPAVGEKGYVDITITIRMPGGHSSIPPAHTSIGVLSELITLIEEHRYLPRLYDENPILGNLQCGAEHAPEFPSKIKKLLSKRGSSKKAETCVKKKAKPDALAEEVAKLGLPVRYMMQTSQAVDIIDGGVKVNALPERVSAIVNHRINIGERPKDAQAKVELLAKKVAKKYGLKLHAYDDVEEPSSIMLVAQQTMLEPAPVTPTEIYDGDVISAYGILSGTTRAIYGNEVYMSPGLSTGNTDTRFYWDLTRHIFRFGPGYEAGDDGGLGNIHTVDEHVSVVAHINSAKWFSMFVRNMDEAEMA